METLELFYPQIAARAGPYTFDKGIEIEVYSSKSSYFDWAKIRFTEQFQPKISLARKDPAAIELGYNNAFDDSPAWEDITAQVAINRVYNFLNESKTAEKWGVNVRFTITKNEGYEEEVSISGFGGAYE